MSFDGPPLSLSEAHGQPHGPPKVHEPWGHYTPLPFPSRWPCSPVHIGVHCTFTVTVQVFLVLLQTVTGLAVLYVPVAGYRYHTRLTLTVK